jgi:type VI secretion system secreted protein Hcp
MSSPAYLNLKAEKQGVIKGSVTQKGREDKIMVIAVSHDVVSPRDAASGLPTGKRQHKPYVITKEIDKASPVLYTVLCGNENITEWQLQYWKPSPTGAEVQYYTVKLTNANIASIHHKMLNMKDVNLARFETMEEVAFTYEKIEWTWMDGGVSGMDSWIESA